MLEFDVSLQVFLSLYCNSEFIANYYQLSAMMVMSGLQTDQLEGTTVAGWKYVGMKPGAQCVMTLGTVLMLEWSAGN